MLTFSVLGPLEVRRDGVRLALGPRRHAELLALLVTRPRTVVPGEVLADQLWEGAPPATAINTLQGYISGLRRALEPERAAREPARVLVTHAVGYRLDVEDDVLDVPVFRARVADARRLAGQGRLREAVDAVRAALALWRGPALADVADASWARPVIRALEEERLAAEDLLVDLRLDGHEIEDLVGGLRRHLAAEPLRERRAAQLMRVLYRTGRQAEALDVARETRTTLEEQLGIDPGPELRELELAILRQDDSVLLPQRGLAPAPAAPVPRAPSLGRLPGREPELALLAEAGAAARSGTTTVVLVMGEAGIGKTRLVQEATAALPGFRVLTGRCSNLEGTPPYWPWRQVLALLGPAGSAPVTTAETTDAGEIAASRFEQAIRLTRRLRSAAEDQPVVLLLDDVQWGDAPSLQLLELVLDQLVDAAVLVILTSRVVGPSSPYPVTRVLATLGRHPSAQRIHLLGLDEEAVKNCITEVTGRAPGAAAVAEVHRRSGGNPYFARELARLLDDDRLRPGVPVGVRDVIRMRTGALGAGVRDLLAAGAVLGRDFSVATVQDMLGVDAPTFVPVVEEALDAGLLVEPVPGRLRFEHALVHEAVREDLSSARALTLHARAAESLRRRERPPQGVLAHHLLHAQDPRGFEAAAYAAEQDLAQLAVEPALELVDHALASADLVAADPASVRALRLLRGLALGRLGRLDEGRSELVWVALAAEAALDREQLARAALAMAGDGAVGGYWTTMAPASGGTDEVVTWLRHALDSADTNSSPATRVALRSALATQLAVTGQPDPELADAAVGEAQGLDRRSRIRALTARWATLWTPDHAGERLQIAHGLLELAGQDIPDQLAARHLLAHALLEVGDLAGSDRQIALLAETEARHRNPDFALLLLWWRSMRALMSGDLAGAEQLAQQLATQLGQVTGRAAATATLSLRTVSGIVAWERGQLGPAASQLDLQSSTSHPGWQAVRALAHADHGNPATAHRVLHEAFGPQLEKLGSDSTALAPLVLGAETLARAGDNGQATAFFERLRIHAGAVIVFAPGAVCMGAGTLYTGTTAALAGDLTRARTDLEDAVDRNSALGAHPFTMRSLSRLAAVLSRTGDAPEAAARLRQAQEIARLRGLGLVPFAC